MDDDVDGHSCMMEYDANYSRLTEQCFNIEQLVNNDPQGAVTTEPLIEPGTVTVRPQGARDDFRSKFEAMERKFRDEFLSTVDTLAAATTDQDGECQRTAVPVSE